MKNKFEGDCYVCGQLVEEEKGIAEQIKRPPYAAGFGDAIWAVRHKDCRKQTAEEWDAEIERVSKEMEAKSKK
jgi:hypothetical protein